MRACASARVNRARFWPGGEKCRTPSGSRLETIRYSTGMAQSRAVPGNRSTTEKERVLCPQQSRPCFAECVQGSPLTSNTRAAIAWLWDELAESRLRANNFIKCMRNSRFCAELIVEQQDAMSEVVPRPRSSGPAFNGGIGRAIVFVEGLAKHAQR